VGASVLVTVTYDAGAGPVDIGTVTIAGGSKRGTQTVAATVPDGSLLQLDIDQVGSTTAGEHLIVDLYGTLRPLGAVNSPRTP
jgi:hypothetical protein